MKEIKTVALVGLGAIGAYFADRLQPVLGDDHRLAAREDGGDLVVQHADRARVEVRGGLVQHEHGRFVH